MATNLPKFEKMRAETLAQKAVIEATSAPLRAERKKLRDKITPDLDRLRELDKLIHAAEQPALAEINKDLVGLTKMLGQVKPKEESKGETMTITKEDVGVLSIK